MNRYSLVILILSALIVVISVWKSDWSWFIVTIIGIAVVLAPMLVASDSNSGYDQHLVGIAVIPLLAFIFLFAANLFFNLKYYYLVSLATLACASTAFGMMIAVFLNARTKVSLSKRWIILFALTFACSLSVLFMFLTFIWMNSLGYPLYNSDFSNTLENNGVNTMLMLPWIVTTFATIIYGVIFRWYLKSVDFLGLSNLSVGGK